ncbi:MAG: hypothetical protein WA194_06425 [Patescibacteria group bacterium]
MKHGPFFILWIIFLTSTLSSALLTFYLDPETNFTVAFTAMGIAVFLAIASFSSITFYGFKKVYYRGEIHPGVFFASVRQGILFSLVALGLVAFFSLSLLTPRTGGLLVFIALLIELMLESVSTS